jgi:hypothetical protein
VSIRRYAGDTHAPPGVASLGIVPSSRGGGRGEAQRPPLSPLPSASSGLSWHIGNNAVAGQRGCDGQERRSETRAERMRLRRTSRSVAYEMCQCVDRDGPEHRKCWAERMAVCGLYRLSANVGISVRETAEHGRRARYTGLETCKSLSCPVCCGYLRERVAEKLADAARRWDRAGNAALYAVLTVPHGVADTLDGLHDKESAMWRRITSSSRWKRLRDETGLEYLRTDEVTHSADSGFHPHLNFYLVSSRLDDSELAVKVIPVLRKLWAAECRKQGFPLLSAAHGVHVEVVQSSEQIAGYITKDFGIARELTRGDLKRGHGASRTYLQILADYRASRDAGDLRLLGEFMRGTRGRRMLNVSRGFWLLMASVGVDEPSEDEMADDAGDGESAELGRIPAVIWDRVCRTRGLDAELLKAAETGGQEAVVRLLSLHKAFMVDARGDPVWPFPAPRRKPSYVQPRLELAS